MHEPDNRTPTPPPNASEPDWDTIQPTYEAPGARNVVPDMPPIPDVTTLDPPKDNWTWTHDDWHNNRQPPPKPLPPALKQRIAGEYTRVTWRFPGAANVTDSLNR